MIIERYVLQCDRIVGRLQMKCEKQVLRERARMYKEECGICGYEEERNGE